MAAEQMKESRAAQLQMQHRRGQTARGMGVCRCSCSSMSFRIGCGVQQHVREQPVRNGFGTRICVPQTPRERTARTWPSPSGIMPLSTRHSSPVTQGNLAAATNDAPDQRQNDTGLFPGTLAATDKTKGNSPAARDRRGARDPVAKPELTIRRHTHFTILCKSASSTIYATVTGSQLVQPVC